MEEPGLVATVHRMIREGLTPEALARRFSSEYASIGRACLHGPAACEHVDFFARQARELLSLIHADVPQPTPEQRQAFLLAGVQRMQALRRRFRYEHRQRLPRRPYADVRCGAYPFRDAGHDALRVIGALDMSEPAMSGRRYAYADVEPFARVATRQADRAALYRRQLAARRMKWSDLLDPGEASLVGQWGLFATTAIPEGTCLGIYGGQLLRGSDWMMLPDDRYLIALNDEGDVRLDGETLLSLANTIYTDAQNLVHAQDGYNAEMARFPARLAHGWDMRIPALFTTRDVAPGEEIRWHYGIGVVQVEGVAG